MHRGAKTPPCGGLGVKPPLPWLVWLERLAILGVGGVTPPPPPLVLAIFRSHGKHLEAALHYTQVSTPRLAGLLVAWRLGTEGPGVSMPPLSGEVLACRSTLPSERMPTFNEVARDAFKL